MHKRSVNPYVLVVIGVLAVSSSAIFVKFSTAPAPVIAFYRLLFTNIIMLPLFIWKYKKELRLISKKDWLYSIISGVFLAFHFILWFESLNYTSVASSTVLVTLQPLFAFVGAYFFFKEKFRLASILSGLLGIFGSIIISWGDFRISGMALYGDVLALVACGMITAYLLFGQTVRKRLSLITYTFVVYGISTVTLFLYVILFGYSFYPYPMEDWLLFILLAIIPTLLGHTLFNWSLKWLSTSTISIAILFEPVGAAILAYYLLHEAIVWTQIVGGVVIIIGIAFYTISERKGYQKALKKRQS